jgi:hypothetical protein
MSEIDITLEKVELVKDRTGVSYKEAKAALEETDGSVVDAIIKLEEELNETAKSKIGEYAKGVSEKIKTAVEKGNVSKIIIKKDDEVFLNLPVTVGIVGAILAPLGVVAGAIATFGFKCKVELIKDDGDIIDVSSAVNEQLDKATAKGSDIATEIKDKGSDIFDSIKKTADTKIKPGADAAKDKFDEMWEKAKGGKKSTEPTDDADNANCEEKVNAGCEEKVDDATDNG